MSDPKYGGALAAQALADAGIESVFALPGGHIHPLFEGVGAAGLNLYVSRHEENAVLMAAGWALATGKPAVAAVTAGPGLTNALPGIAEANASGIPVVVLAGRTGLAQRQKGAVQDVDQLAIVAPVTKWRAEVLRTDQICTVIAEAVHQARSGTPGVAYVEVPKDVFSAAIEPARPPWPTGFVAQARSAPLAADVAQAVALLSEAQRPAVLAGSGAFFSGAAEALAAFAERIGLPVVTTAAARGLLDDDHDKCLGSLVHGGVALVSADVALVLGSRFNANVTYGGPPLFGIDQKVIQVDVRPENIGGLRRPDVALVGDVTATLETLTAAWSAPSDTHAGWLAEAKAAAAASRSMWEAEAQRPVEGINPGYLALEAARFADGKGVFVADGGDSVIWGISFAAAHAPGSALYIGSAMGTLGVGLPFAIGAGLARPGKPVFLYTGDGAFGMSAMEIDTAARHGVPIVVVVVNNGGWGDEGEIGIAPSEMHYALLAEAVGGHGERITEPDEIVPALKRALGAAKKGVPAIIDAVVNPSVMSDFMRNYSGLDLM
jgi:acetolactate synthase-1/2/3 large subunit